MRVVKVFYDSYQSIEKRWKENRFYFLVLW